MQHAQLARVGRRKQMRIATKQVVRYHAMGSDGQALRIDRLSTTLASDVSQSGMFLMQAQLPPGTHVHFYFELPGGYIEAVGKVVHNQHRPDAGGVARPGSGVRFIRMGEGDRARLGAYLDGHTAGHRIPEAGVA